MQVYWPSCYLTTISRTYLRLFWLIIRFSTWRGSQTGPRCGKWWVLVTPTITPSRWTLTRTFCTYKTCRKICAMLCPVRKAHVRCCFLLLLGGITEYNRHFLWEGVSSSMNLKNTVMTNSESNDKKRNASTVTNTLQKFNKKSGRRAQARISPLNYFQWTYFWHRNLWANQLKRVHINIPMMYVLLEALRAGQHKNIYCGVLRVRKTWYYFMNYS